MLFWLGRTRARADEDQTFRAGEHAEIVGALAIVVSLIFVGMEIRQTSEETALNTRAVRASAYQDLVGHVLTLNSDLYNNPQLAELVSRMLNGGEPTSTTEAFQFLQVVNFLLEHGDMAYYQYQIGNMDQERLNNIIGVVGNYSRASYFREIWEPILKERVDPEFARYLEENIFQF
jgi:hypothetical protein